VVSGHAGPTPRALQLEVATRSFRIAALLDGFSTAGVITLGDALGFVGGHAKPTKLAAMEALGTTETPPMPLYRGSRPSGSRR